jgi:tetratricopeptide (TPR) repeat protein
MDALYGMLRALGAEVPDDPGQLETLLRGQTEKVKAMIAERDTLKSTDAEIMRLSGLADQALAEGALDTAIALRQQAKARAREVEATVDDAEAQLRQRRIEIAEVFGKSAEAYALGFKHREGRPRLRGGVAPGRALGRRAGLLVPARGVQRLSRRGKIPAAGRPTSNVASETGQRAASMVERLLADRPGDKQYWEDIAAQTLNNWANATNALFSATKRPEALAQSIDAYERAPQGAQPRPGRAGLVVVQHNLAGALMHRGETDTGNDTLERAVDAYKAALTVWTREADPQLWALATANMANAQSILAKRNRDEATLRESIALLNGALEIQTPEGQPMDWAWTQRELGNTYADLAGLTRDEADIRKSIEATQQALTIYTLERAPRAWAQAMHAMAHTYQTVPTSEARADVLGKSSASTNRCWRRSTMKTSPANMRSASAISAMPASNAASSTRTTPPSPRASTICAAPPRSM